MASRALSSFSRAWLMKKPLMRSASEAGAAARRCNGYTITAAAWRHAPRYLKYASEASRTSDSDEKNTRRTRGAGPRLKN